MIIKKAITYSLRYVSPVTGYARVLKTADINCVISTLLSVFRKYDCVGTEAMHFALSGRLMEFADKKWLRLKIIMDEQQISVDK